jgi:hypothetical protein
MKMKKPKGMKRGGAGKMPMKEKDGKMVPAFLKKGGPTKKAKSAAKKKAAKKAAAKKGAKKMSYGGKTMKAKGMQRGGKTMNAKGMKRGGKPKGMMYGGKPVYKSRMS